MYLQDHPEDEWDPAIKKDLDAQNIFKTDLYEFETKSVGKKILNALFPKKWK